MKKNEILDAFMFRHACKEFTDRKIPSEDFDFILETARLSPSSFGFEPWHFLVVQDQKIRDKFAPVTWGGGKQFKTASHVIFALVKKPHYMRYDSEYIHNFMQKIQELPEDIVKLKTDFYKNFQEKDFDLINSERAMTDWAALQTYIPLANMMTAAAMIGIDSCPMEGYQKKEFDSLLKSELNIDLNKYSIVYCVAFGYRKEDPSRSKTRQQLKEVVTWIK